MLSTQKSVHLHFRKKLSSPYQTYIQLDIGCLKCYYINSCQRTLNFDQLITRTTSVMRITGGIQETSG